MVWCVSEFTKFRALESLLILGQAFRLRGLGVRLDVSCAEVPFLCPFWI